MKEDRITNIVRHYDWKDLVGLFSTPDLNLMAIFFGGTRLTPGTAMVRVELQEPSVPWQPRTSESEKDIPDLWFPLGVAGDSVVNPWASHFHMRGNAQLQGTACILGVPHWVNLYRVRVEDGEQVADVPDQVNDESWNPIYDPETVEVLAKLHAEAEGALRTVKVPGMYGDWVLRITPYGD